MFAWDKATGPWTEGQGQGLVKFGQNLIKGLIKFDQNLIKGGSTVGQKMINCKPYATVARFL